MGYRCCASLINSYFLSQELSAADAILERYATDVALNLFLRDLHEPETSFIAVLYPLHDPAATGPSYRTRRRTRPKPLGSKAPIISLLQAFCRLQVAVLAKKSHRFSSHNLQPQDPFYPIGGEPRLYGVKDRKCTTVLQSRVRYVLQ